MFGNPLFIFDSGSRKCDFVAVYPIIGINENHTPVMISIHPDASANRIEVNLITSFYAKDSKNTFKNWADQGLLRYVDDMNNSEVALAVRLQLPSGVTTSSNFNILRKSDIVKDRIRYQEYLPPEDRIEIRYQSYYREDLTEREKTRSGMKMYQRISHEELLPSLTTTCMFLPTCSSPRHRRQERMVRIRMLNSIGRSDRRSPQGR